MSARPSIDLSESSWSLCRSFCRLMYVHVIMYVYTCVVANLSVPPFSLQDISIIRLSFGLQI